MFRGASTVNLDSKGRLAIPSRYRAPLAERCGGNLVLTVNNTAEPCLWLYPLDEWQQIERRLIELPSFDAHHLRLKRLLMGNARELEMDRSGRILLPTLLREMVKLERAICLVGQGNKFELWDDALWRERCQQWINPDTEGGSGERSLEVEQLVL